MPGWQGWAEQVLRAMKLPVTPNNLQFLSHDWYLAESGGGGGANNPLNTTRMAPGLEGATNYNSAGVKNYLNPQQGLRATVGALSMDYYKNIVAALATGRATRAQLASLVEQSPWGTKHFPTLGVGQSPNAAAGGSPADPPVGADPTQAQPGTGNPYVDLVNKLEQVHAGLGQSLFPEPSPLRFGATPETQAIAQRVSGTFGEFGKVVASQPSRQIVPAVSALQNIMSAAPSGPLVESPTAPNEANNPGIVSATGPAGLPITKGWSYPGMVQGKANGKNPWGDLSFADHVDFVHVDTGLMNKLNQLGKMLGVRIDVISGYRAPGYSSSTGGYANDPHTRGVAVDAYIGGVPIGNYKNAAALMKRLGLESGAQPGFYHGKPDPEHVQIPGSGVNKNVHARRTLRR